MNYDRNVPAKVKTLIYQTVVGPTFVTAAKHGHCEREREGGGGGREGRKGERGREGKKENVIPRNAPSHPTHARIERERESI